jgi:hypothetical protein
MIRVFMDFSSLITIINHNGVLLRSGERIVKIWLNGRPRETAVSGLAPSPPQISAFTIAFFRPMDKCPAVLVQPRGSAFTLYKRSNNPKLDRKYGNTP